MAIFFLLVLLNVAAASKAPSGEGHGGQPARPGCRPAPGESESALSRRYRSCASHAEVEITRGDPDGFYRRGFVPAHDGDDDGVRTVCDLMSAIVTNCAPILRDCYPGQEKYLAFRDSQVAVFVQFTSQLYGLQDVVTDCPAVKESVARSRQREQQQQQQQKEASSPSSLSSSSSSGGGGEKCSVREMNAHVSAYLDCTREVNAEMEAEIGGSDRDESLVQQIFCNGIYKAIYGCSELLRPCHSGREMEANIQNQKELIHRVMVYKDSVSSSSSPSPSSSPSSFHADVSVCSALGGDVGPALPTRRAPRVRIADLKEPFTASGAGRDASDFPSKIGLLLLVLLSSLEHL